MKLPKSDIGLLFSTPKSAEAPVALAQAPGPSPAAAAAQDRGASSLVKQLKAAAPHLWRKGEAPRLTKKEQRAEFLRLLSWLCGKRGWQLAEQMKQPYPGKAGMVEGRLQACVSAGDESVALELLFELDAAALLKLKAAHQAGRGALLAWAGPPCSRSELLTRASAQLEGTRVHWLDALPLNAG